MLFESFSFFTKDNFVKKTSTLMAGSLLKFLVQFCVLIFFSRKLSLTDYSIYQYLWMILNIFSVATLFGTSQLLLSIAHEDIICYLKLKKQNIIAFFLLLYTVAICYLIFFATVFNIAQVVLIFVLLLLQNTSTIAESIAIKKGLLQKLLYSNITYLVIFLAIHAYCYFYIYSITTILVVLILGSFCKIILLYFIFKKHVVNNTIDSAIVASQWFYLGLNDIFGIVVKWVDKWIILLFLPLINFGIYFNGTYEIPIFGILLSAIGSITLAELAAIKLHDKISIKKIMEKHVLFLAAIIYPSFIFLWLNCNNLIILIFGSKYIESIPIFKVAIWVLPARIIYSTLILQVYNKSKTILKGSILDLILAVFFMFLLFSKYNMKGIALAFVLSTYVQILYYLWHSSKLVNMKIIDFFPIKIIFLFITISSFIPLINFYTVQYFSTNSILLGNIFLCFLNIFILLKIRNLYLQKKYYGIHQKN